MCYHNTQLPVTNFVHLDDVHEPTHNTMNYASFSEDPPNANSSLIEPRICNQTDPCIRQTSVFDESIQETSDRAYSCPIRGGHSHDVGHMSHIPRIPPTPTTFTIPSVTNKSMLPVHGHEEDLFGMIKLQDNDVCYTSGTIEWVGRKRGYPINSGFKVIEHTDDLHKRKLRKLNKTFTGDIDKIKECDCADVLPTVNAIVDHLNALHEAVDLVDLRLNTLEDTTS